MYQRALSHQRHRHGQLPLPGPYQSAEFWLLKFRIFNPDTNGKSKPDHVLDSWYATTILEKYLLKEGKAFYYPIKSSRKVDYAAG
ncbi:hypothetical protein FVR03_18330 [Pontibacter qinzhouensis]|uniref:Uncharacterized protein n=1 Tax=Pontibacter qinzhouensis TaxID=2603253 RepID=A0A5C8J8S8_9BACT|nr:hypothetical protein FVR03_18330 [Pontibacter qinzhouensis]